MTVSPTRTVAVCGSCTSRDNFNSRFNPDHDRYFTVTAEVFQTSMISLMSAPLTSTEIPELLDGPGTDGYQVRITREDVTRSFLVDLAAAQPDYLLLDFFADVHFGVLRLGDGRYLTDNRWMLHPTRFGERLRADEAVVQLRLGRETEEYVALWSAALDRFAGWLAEHCPATRVVVHRGWNTDEVVVGDRARPVRVRDLRQVRRIDVGRVNTLWARLDEHALQTHGWDAIDLRAEGFTSYAEHPWKPFYVHYTPDYQRRFLAELLGLDLAARLDPDDAAQVRAINDAGHERAAAEASRWTGLRRERDERIRELEALGPFRATKFALGQRIRKTRARRGPRAADGGTR